MIQEFHYEFKPTAVIEIGVARGGSVSLAVSMQKLNGLIPKVLGVDVKIFPHTYDSLQGLVDDGFVSLLEADSTSSQAENEIRKFIVGEGQVFAILDSNHSHKHVLSELAVMDRVLPSGSVVLVADGIIEHLPEREDRPWGKGDNPWTAVEQFLRENAGWSRLEKYSRRSIFSEFRDGWIIKL